MTDDSELKPHITSKGFQASNLLILGKIMSQDIAGENPEAHSGDQRSSSMQPQDPALQTVPTQIVEITQPKKKIKVIEIQDSEEEDPKSTKIIRSRERKPLPTPTKHKKMSLRCMLCKEPGKKASMKACLDCKNFSHISCLEQEGEQVVRHLCRKCRHKRQETLTLRRGQKGGQEKSTVRRLEREKKKEEHIKKMGEFHQRYPYYFQDDKVRFPIEDKLLFIYRDIFELPEPAKPRPTAHPLIPANQLADFLQIENFFSTFREQLVAFGSVPSEISKSFFYLSMGSEGLDGIFCGLIQCLLNVYLSDIFQKNKTDNVRILNDHPFFTLMNHMHENEELSQEVLIRTSKEIMRYLSTIPSMKIAFQDLAFPSQLNLDQKVKLILNLIKGLSEIDQFHDLVSIKSQKMQMMTKERTDLVAQLKIDEAENLSNNEKLKDLTQVSKVMEETQEGPTRQVNKELDKHKKKMFKLASQQTKSEQTIKDIRKKISQIGRNMPFLTTEILFLGKDRNESEYFFYVRQPNRIYVKFRGYLMDTNEQFSIYESKQTIIQVLKSLSTKGLKERHLFQNIQSLIKDDIITNDVKPEDSSAFMLEQNKFRDITFEDILWMVKQTEDTFTTYLTVKQYQWAAAPVRQMFMDQLMAINDLQLLKENLRSLQESFLFAEYASPDFHEKKMDESDEEVKDEVREGRRKIPIRIWGINSEKTKKYWIQYLQESIDILGVWLCAHLFKSTVQKYVKKKMEAYYQQQAKERKVKPKENGHTRGRPPLSRKSSDKQERNEKRSRYVASQSSQEVVECRRPNLRERKYKKMNIDSDEDIEPSYNEGEESSQNEDFCEICGEYGDMICCDTCPKVYHADCLKMTTIPEGEWSCYKCLEKLTNQRQTRSRYKKMSKFL